MGSKQGHVISIKAFDGAWTKSFAETIDEKEEQQW
jgi:hypothetical protein